jgi:hypothetical protein
MLRVLAAATLGVALLAGRVPPGAAQPLGPAAVIDAYTAAINAHDVEAALAFVADDAVYLRPGGRFVGKDEVRGFIEGLVAQRAAIELVGERQVFRNYVSWSSRVSLYDPDRPDAPPTVLQNLSESIVVDGQIVFHRASRAP